GRGRSCLSECSAAVGSPRASMPPISRMSPGLVRARARNERPSTTGSHVSCDNPHDTGAVPYRQFDGMPTPVHFFVMEKYPFDSGRYLPYSAPPASTPCTTATAPATKAAAPPGSPSPNRAISAPTTSQPPPTVSTVRVHGRPLVNRYTAPAAAAA